MINPKIGDEGCRIVHHISQWDIHLKDYVRISKRGRLVSWNDSFVFIRYDGDDQIKATARWELEWADGKKR